MESSNVETYRAGHEAFNQRDFVAMTRQYAYSISWTDHSQGRTFRTPQEFKDDFLTGWIGASPDIRITDPRYIDAGQTVVCTFTVAGTHDGRAARTAPRHRQGVHVAALRDVAPDSFSGAWIAGDPLALASALRKFEVYSRGMPTTTNPSTAHLFISNAFKGAGVTTLFSTHPQHRRAGAAARAHGRHHSTGPQEGPSARPRWPGPTLIGRWPAGMRDQAVPTC